MGIFEMFSIGGERGSRKEKSKKKENVFQAHESIRESEKAPIQLGRLATEAPFAGREISEAEEAPRTLSFFQLKYGSVRRESAGPIVRGGEPGITAITPGIPRGIAQATLKAFPERSLFQSNQGQSHSSLIKLNKVIDGVPYVICSRAEQVAEQGGKGGRRSIERNSVAIPASEWSIAVVPQIGKMLDSVEHIQGQSPVLAKAELSTAKLDEKLPEGWFDVEVKELVSRIIEGQPLAIEDSNASEDIFLQKLYYAMLCLPESVARQISFASGLNEMNGDVRVAQGAKALTDRKKTGVEWKNESFDPVSKEFAEKYLAKVVLLVNEGMTGRDMLKAVAGLSPSVRGAVGKQVLADEAPSAEASRVAPAVAKVEDYVLVADLNTKMDAELDSVLAAIDSTHAAATLTRLEEVLKPYVAMETLGSKSPLETKRMLGNIVWAKINGEEGERKRLLAAAARRSGLVDQRVFKAEKTNGEKEAA